MRSAVPVLASWLLHSQIENIVEILWPIRFDFIIGSILWKQISFPITLSQVVGSDSQCLGDTGVIC